MLKTRNLHLIGCASGTAGADPHSGDGPTFIKQSALLAALENQGIAVQWDNMIVPRLDSLALRIDESVRNVCEPLAKATAALTRQKQFFTVLGGDHSCAIGTWSGVYDALHEQGDIGLIWIDAHMDSHTPETSPSGRIHGMPLACLLGYGYFSLTSILQYAPKIKPENVCLIGVRSFEEGEAKLLERLQVRVYFMDEVNERGVETVMQEAIQHVNKHTIGYGVSIDLDALDPKEAPGVDVPESGGMHATELKHALAHLVADTRLIAAEIVEFDPSHDQNNKTEQLIVSMLETIANGR